MNYAKLQARSFIKSTHHATGRVLCTFVYTREHSVGNAETFSINNNKSEQHRCTVISLYNDLDSSSDVGIHNVLGWSLDSKCIMFSVFRSQPLLLQDPSVGTTYPPLPG